MKRAGCVLLGALASSPAAAACELVLTEHRSGQLLHRLALPAGEVQIAFEHSVLGTTVSDRYRFEVSPAGSVGIDGIVLANGTVGTTGSTAFLVEEQFEGQGYGLPHTAGPGETLTREGGIWRLKLHRAVHPLVVRPLPAQHMRLVVQGREWPLAAFSNQAIELRAEGCAPPHKPT